MNELLSLVVPVYFEQDCIDQFIKEVIAELNLIDIDYEIIFIDDGSKDQTVSLIKKQASINPKIKLIEFSYNHGKQAAVSAGIRFAKGDYLLYMDPDLQDPPVEIKNFLTKIKQGHFDLIFGIRKSKKDSLLNRFLSALFWRTLERFTGLELPRGLAVMRIFNRKFADEFLRFSEQNRFIEGIFMLVGMNQSTLEITQRERFAGKTKFNFKRKMALAFDAIYDFSELPLKLSLRLGFFLSAIGILSLVVIIILKLFMINFQAGWPSLMGALILSNGLIMSSLGICAIYIGKIYKETKRRPLFSIKNLTNL